MAARKQAIPTPAFVLGISGLIPFIVTAMIICIPSAISEQVSSGLSASDWQNHSAQALGAYGAVILSFLGGIRWGKLLNDKASLKVWKPLCLSVVPSLIAWIALLLPPVWMLSVLAAGFVMQYAFDIEAVKNGVLPPWFGRLRSILTTGAVLSLLSGLLAYFLLPVN